MSTITRELAKLFRKITNSEIDAEGNAHVVLSPADSLLINNARIALASLEAEPVAWAHRLINKRNGVVHPWVYGSAEACPSEGDIFNIEVMPLYTAPPAQVSVPEWTNEQCLEFLSIAFRHAEIKGDLELDDIRLGVKMVNGSRAAMLQGAERVTTAYKLPFEQWLSQQTGTIDVECGCVMTEVFFHWLRVAYEAGNSPVIPDGWVMVPVELTGAMTNAMTDAILDDLHNVDVWRSVLAAAPQQEVKP
ncbi:DUF551 domain-containing protein [Enterobacter chengduensis]|uniref:DUF551 domain-containing protein n=1 Tax=Enterobacter chengduensis TaxID=2494701 RepID=UPI000AE096F5|nr:DUF551 domain-containing protein [Enterobacter chengduensis]